MTAPPTVPADGAATHGRASLALHAAIVITTLGMMLVVAGVITTGLFLPGVFLIGVGLVVFAVAAMLSALAPAAPEVRPAPDVTG